MSLPQFTTTTKVADNKNATPQTLVRVFNSLISNLNHIFTALLKKVQLDSVILTNQTISGVTTLPHTLGRTLSGWQIIRQRSPGLIWDNQDTNTDPGTYLVLKSTEAVVVDLLVF